MKSFMLRPMSPNPELTELQFWLSQKLNLIPVNQELPSQHWLGNLLDRPLPTAKGI